MIPASFFALGNRLRHAADTGRAAVDWSLALACLQMAFAICVVCAVVQHYLGRAS